MSAIVLHYARFPRAAHRVLGGILDALSGLAAATAAAREAERLLLLSDADLARRGLARDRVVQHAFRAYLDA